MEEVESYNSYDKMHCLLYVGESRKLVISLINKYKIIKHMMAWHGMAQTGVSKVENES